SSNRVEEKSTNRVPNGVPVFRFRRKGLKSPPPCLGEHASFYPAPIIHHYSYSETQGERFHQDVVISIDDTKEDGTSTCQPITVGCAGGKQKMESESVFGGASKRR
ncbi:hypothetical protein AVEN_31091-1, partial [Araneus ventricosus]